MSAHNPYFSPHQLGGTMRRPIVDRVEACRPRHCDDPGCSMVLMTWPLPAGPGWIWFHLDSPGKPQNLESLAIEPKTALALCRVAVEGWILNDVDSEKALTIGWDHDQWQVNYDGHRGENVDLDSALNALAHALADAMNIPA